MKILFLTLSILFCFIGITDLSEIVSLPFVQYTKTDTFTLIISNTLIIASSFLFLKAIKLNRK